MRNIPDLKALWITDVHANTSVNAALAVWGDANPITGIGKRYVGYDDISVPAALNLAVSEDVDVIVVGGDNINGGAVGSGNQRALNAQRFVAYFNGIGIPTVINFGHWDFGASASPDATDFGQVYDDGDGFGTLMPETLTTWTPGNIAGIATNTPVAYTYEINNYVFVVLHSTIASGNVDLATEDSGSQTQNQWLTARLSEIDSADKQAVVMIHRPLINGPDWSILTDQPGKDDAIASFEGMSRKPIVFQGHVHEDTSTIQQNGVLYRNGRGNLWTPIGDTDTSRQSHSIVTVRPNAVGGSGSQQRNIEMAGYGYSETKEFDKYFIG